MTDTQSSDEHRRPSHSAGVRGTGQARPGDLPMGFGTKEKGLQLCPLLRSPAAPQRPREDWARFPVLPELRWDE